MGCGCGGSQKAAPPPTSRPKQRPRPVRRVVQGGSGNPLQDPGYYWNGPERPEK